MEFYKLPSVFFVILLCNGEHCTLDVPKIEYICINAFPFQLYITVKNYLHMHMY
jgi:hypothetical protein